METTKSDKLKEGAGGDYSRVRIEEDGFAGMCLRDVQPQIRFNKEKVPGTLFAHVKTF